MPIRGKDLITKLRAHGFVLVRQRGSHCVLKHEDGRVTVVPVHSGEELGPGLLAKILRDCKLTKKQVGL